MHRPEPARRCPRRSPEGDDCVSDAVRAGRTTFERARDRSSVLCKILSNVQLASEENFCCIGPDFARGHLGHDAGFHQGNDRVVGVLQYSSC
jgi:hypothetical protein